MATQQQQVVAQLPPEALLANDNSRFGLISNRVESLMEDIVAKGGVMVPLEVERLAQPVDGVEFRINMGHYRHAAVARLNKEKGAGLLLPCLVVAPIPEVDRMKRQVAENFERKELTPIDMGVAIKRLMEAGVTRQEVREMFKRPGGRKGNKTQPASNSIINMYMSFLDFPKAVQSKIHEGLIGVDGAYKLHKVFRSHPEKLNEIVAQLDQDRLDSIAQEEKDEEKYLEGLRKEQEREARVAEAQREREDAEKALAESAKRVDELAALEAEAYKISKSITVDPATSKEEKAKAEAEFRLAENATKEAIKAAEQAKKDKEKLDAKMESAKKAAEERAKKLAAARKEADKAAKKAASGKDVAKAAAKVGVQTGRVPLTLAQIREVIHALALPSAYAKVQLIGKALEDCVSGGMTDRQLLTAISKITGEYTEPKTDTKKKQ